MEIKYVTAELVKSDLRYHDNNRAGFQRYFTERLAEEPGIEADVLDIGCGPGLPLPLQPLANRWNTLDGLDPNADEVKAHPLLSKRWATVLEEATIPSASYDLAYSYNVAEHVATPSSFFAKVINILKPGGVYWALSNHTLHPFARIVRLIERANLKRTYARNSSVKVNNYPAFYRCNSAGQVLHHCPMESVASIEFHLYPSMQWDTYFPTPMRFIPHCYDYCLGTRFSSAMMIFMVRIEKKTD